MRITREQLEAAYKKGLIVCRLKCQNGHTRDAIKHYRMLLDADAEFDYMANAKEQCKRGYFDMYCYECACSPDFDTMLKELNREESKHG